MEARNHLLAMELGAVQCFENMAVFPLRFPGDGGPGYITLKEALERGALVVAEVSAGGSVPELMVENKGDAAVLILDGEELAGAKQNRVLNTTILVGPRSATKIPVSCTEHGRWSYVSEVFQESGNVMAPALRKINMAGVHFSLREVREFHGNQGAVWDGIARMHLDADVAPGTGAMRDVFEAKRTVLEDYLKSFGLEDGQKGALVFIGGEVAGLDFVSRAPAYAGLHAKLVRSYAMEAMLAGERAKAGKRRGKKEKGRKKGKEKEGARGKAFAEGTTDGGVEGGVGKPREGGDAAGGAAEGGRVDETAAREFMARAAECDETRYPSVGLGSSLRYEGGGVIGSALAVDGSIVHMAFFSAPGEGDAAGERAERMASISLRRRFRTD